MMAKSWDTLIEMFHDTIAAHGSRRLFGVKRGGVYCWSTFNDFKSEVDAVAAGLSSLGFGEGDTAALISDNRPEWASAAYGTMRLGGRFVPMYESQLLKDWRYILEDSSAKVLFVANKVIAEKTRVLIDELEHLEHIFVIDAEGEGSFKSLCEGGRGHSFVEPSIEPGDTAILLYTSGTTGQPKGVLLTHANLCANLNAFQELLPINKEDSVLSFLPWSHAFGQTAELHLFISKGGAMGLVESSKTIIENLSEVRPTVLISVPRIFNRIFDGVHRKMSKSPRLSQRLFNRTISVAGARRSAKGPRRLGLEVQHRVLDRLVARKIRARFGGRLRFCVSGGAALSQEVAEFMQNLGITIYEGYGLSETSPVISVNVPGRTRLGSVGPVLPNVEVKIVPDELAPEGQGEIVVYGPSVMKGYHNLPEETRAAFSADGGFRTGDMGRLDEEGFLWITGRFKEQYKLENGKYVVPGHLEERLKLSPYIANIMVDGSGRPFNIAIIVPEPEVFEEWCEEQGLDAKSDATLEDPRVRALFEAEVGKLSDGFKGYEHPRRFLVVREDFTTDNDLATPSMKIKRRNVRVRYEAGIDALYC